MEFNMTERTYDSEFAVQQITIDRVRHFRRFKTPSLIECIDEITFYNTGGEISSVEYILDSFSPSLHIFDSNGNQLEFHGDHEDEDEDENEIGFKIRIDFPIDKAMSQGEFRTIRIEFIKEVNPETFKDVLITVPLHETASVYVFLEECDNYDFSTIHYGALDENYNLVENDNMTVYRGESFWHIASKAAKNNSGLLYIIFKHKITKTLHSWIIMGLIFGFISAFFIWRSYHFNPSNAVGIATYTGFIISYLFIIKGWLFSKNMDKKLIQYDLSYRFLISILFFEITGILVHYNIIRQ